MAEKRTCGARLAVSELTGWPLAMSDTILEKTRGAHEDIELFDRAAAFALMDDPKNVF